MKGTIMAGTMLFALVAAEAGAQAAGTATATFLGRASVKLRTASGFTVYVDPYAPGDYSEPADLVLVTHGHGDHNKVSLVTFRSGKPVVAGPAGSYAGLSKTLAEGDSFVVGPVVVRPVAAYNKNHRRGETLGYLVSFDGLVVYHGGDTSYVPEMEGLASAGIDWAFLPCDGYYNMDPAEAARCALAVKAKKLVPIHSSGNGMADRKQAEAVPFPGKVVLDPGETVKLVK